MNAAAYFFNPSNWSFPGLILIVCLFGLYLVALRSKNYQKVLFGIALSLLYLVLGSPLANLPQFGLHSITMLQHITLLMLVPVLLLRAIPLEAFNNLGLNTKRTSGWANKYYLIAWSVGAVAMWGGHFLSAAITSAKTGTAICGIVLQQGSWIKSIPEALVFGLLLLAGLFFALPVFHPDPSKRLQPIQCVIYLFTSCVSCSLLGLYVVFSATSASLAEALPVFNTLRNPFPISVRTDQEMAGMLMWVPGCIFYVIASVDIMLRWYDTNPNSEVKESMALKVSEKTPYNGH